MAITEAAKARIVGLVKAHALTLAKPGEEFVLKSGQKSSYYLDCRNLHLTPEGLMCVATNMWAEMFHMGFDAFGGPCIGADPIVGALTYLAGMSPFSSKYRGFLVRKEEKSHGVGGRVVGPLRKGDRCVIVEDVVTTGQSSLEAIRAVEDFGAKVAHVICVVDRKMGGAEAFAAAGYDFRSLITVEDLGL